MAKNGFSEQSNNFACPSLLFLFICFVLFCFFLFLPSLLNYNVNLPDFDFSRRELPDFNMTRQAAMITEIYTKPFSQWSFPDFMDVRSLCPSTDPNRFPPLWKNWSDFLEINNFSKNKTFQVDVWPISCLNDSEIQDRGLKEFNQKNFSRGNMLRTAPLEACALGSRLGNGSVVILDPRLMSILPYADLEKGIAFEQALHNGDWSERSHSHWETLEREA